MWDHGTCCPASIQVRMLPALHCKSSAAGFAAVRVPAMPSVVFMFPLLNTCTIIIFGLVFLKLFPPYSRTTEKNLSSSLPIFLDMQRLKVTLQVSLPIPGCAPAPSGSAAGEGPVRLRHRGEAARECFWGEQRTRGLWNGLTGLVLCLEVLSKESGSAMPPSQRLVQCPAGGRLFSTDTPPKWQRNRA